MKIAVCDDEAWVTNEIKSYLEQYYGEKTVVDVYHSGTELLTCDEKYAVIFLDISMDDISGIDLAKKIRELDRNSFIVFVTNYSDYYQRAFSVHAFEYVLKPITRERIFRLLDEIKLYKQKEYTDDYILVKNEGETTRVPVNHINYFEYTGRKVKVVLDNEVLMVNSTLKDMEKLVASYVFVVPHRAFVVNLKKIKALKQYDILMENGDIVPIAQKKATVFKKEFEKYLFKRIEN